MLFVDGENLSARYQSMLAEGYVAQDGNVHERDVFVWQPKHSLPGYHQVFRAYYYASVLGDDDKLDQMHAKIKACQAIYAAAPGSQNSLHPVLFKRKRGAVRSKGVDIQLAVDALIHVHNDNLDVLALFTGDGDYMPLVKEVMRRGKAVYVCAFSSGCSESIRRAADEFVNLDSCYFDLNRYTRKPA